VQISCPSRRVYRRGPKARANGFSKSFTNFAIDFVDFSARHQTRGSVMLELDYRSHAKISALVDRLRYLRAVRGRDVPFVFCLFWFVAGKVRAVGYIFLSSRRAEYCSTQNQPDQP